MTELDQNTSVQEAQIPAAEKPQEPAEFTFLKGSENVTKPKDGQPFNWENAAGIVRQHLGDALNARNVSFLFGSGCSSLYKSGKQVGIPTMKPMAEAFLSNIGADDKSEFISQSERDALKNLIGLDVANKDYAANLERLMEVLFSIEKVLKNNKNDDLSKLSPIVKTVIRKLMRYVLKCCTKGAFSENDDSVLNLYQSFYQKLIFRDRALPRPWVFTTNYDLFSETAMDRRGIPYCNGFIGSIERSFNPTVFRYSLAEQLDITSRKWSAVDSFVYLCKLHGSVNWVEEGKTLFPIREMQIPPDNQDTRVLIYPTPAKQNASFASPYSDLFREFQGRIVRDQSVLVTVGYSFGDEHINNIIFQALTVPNFRLIAFLDPSAPDVPQQLRELGDPRVWMIGGGGLTANDRAHYFNTFVEKFMPVPPANKIDSAVSKVLETLISRPKPDGGDDNGVG